MKKIFISQSKDYNCGYHDGYVEAIEKVDAFLRINLPRVIENCPINNEGTHDMLNEDIRANLKEYLDR